MVWILRHFSLFSLSSLSFSLYVCVWMKQEGSFWMRKDDKKERCPSFRIYYNGGASGSVPFEWESEPGTPKHRPLSHHDDSPLPPLTPPPSHHYQSHLQPRKRPIELSRFWWWSGHSHKVKKVALIDRHYNTFRRRRKREKRKMFYSFDSRTSSMDMDCLPGDDDDDTASDPISCFPIPTCHLW